MPTYNFIVGDLELIADKNILQCNWLLARITEIHHSNDNVNSHKTKKKNLEHIRPAANL